MGSFQTPMATRTAKMLETSCVGEDEFEREKVLVDLEHECLQIYRRKVDDANMSRARLHQELADSEAQFTHLILSLDDRSLPGRPEKLAGTLKEQLGAIAPALRKMQTRKAERMKQFRAVQLQIHKISAEIAGQSEYDDSLPEAVVNENDLSLKKLEEYQMKLQGLEADKSDRLERVKNYIIAIQNLSAMLGMDSSMIITKVHPSLNELSGLSKNMSDRILAKLNATVESLEAEKRSRIEKLHNLGNSLKNLWDLMDTPYIDRQLFSHILGSITSTNISAPGSLSITMIEQAEAEVERLDQLKASKMKELLVKKQTELEEICRRSHMEVPSLSKTDHIVNLINRGEMDYADLLKSMDEQITRAEDEASSRKMIMEKVEKWVLARDEERWLEEYTMDDKRYTVSRGAHKNLKRAERARAMVNKISALVESLILKTKSWEEERKKVFLYDDVPLLALMEEYNMSRIEKEEEKQQRQREKKITHSQVVVLHESVMLTRPTTGSRRQLDRSVDGGFKIRGSTGVQLVTNNVRSSYQNALKGSQGPKIFARARIDRHLREDQASGGSPFSLN
ncbi:65-kDa microtubule-associated protein 8 [Cynara cardunculus var. scolymus]|uniref:65-kDa microtubule-associated protein 8 n=1 Tax=Cynara cardunculus var. scolymus TaxID=59895 RepID=UPI000D62DB23|nr:65-kDa microtubule-associated protein 8 [Cynara cardunculus var. scolymus]